MDEPPFKPIFNISTPIDISNIHERDSVLEESKSLKNGSPNLEHQISKTKLIQNCPSRSMENNQLHQITNLYINL